MNFTITQVPASLPTDGGRTASLQLDVLEQFPADERFAAQWDATVERLRGSVYMTFPWLRTWWAHYGADAKLALFVAESGGEIVGLVPIYVARLRAGVVSCRVARLVGANIPPKAFDPPLHPEWSRRIIEAVCGHLFSREGVDLISFGPLSDEAPGAAGLREAFTSGAAGGRAREHACDVLTVFRLPASFDEYLASLGQSERHFRKKKLRQLTRDGVVTRQVVEDPAGVEEEYERFLAQHASQWRTEGRGGHFHAWPRAVDFNRALVKGRGTVHQPLFFRFLVNGSVVANRYVYRLGNRLYSELTSREVGREWDRIGLGTISSHDFIEAAIGLQITEVSSGLGHYDHKARQGGREIPTRVWRVVGSGRWRQFKVRVFLACNRAVRVVVHKVWYRRIVPRLPAGFARSQPLFLVRIDC